MRCKYIKITIFYIFLKKLLSIIIFQIVKGENMGNKYKLGLLAVSTAMVLVGCGGVEDIVGGDDSSGDGDYTPTSFTGQFIDAPVQGLNYTCTGMLNGESGVVTHTGVTNSSGEFTCNDGDSVEFAIGKYVLGQHQLSGMQSEYDKVITPYKLQVGNSNAAIDIAQLTTQVME